jgi:Asp-tRNA(Asn)/Glu-tRNA(Gln) amidotransferase A subunit family amidase
VNEKTLYKSVAELSRMIRAKQISPVELTSAYLKRAQGLDPQLFAVVTFTEELAIAQAKQAEREVMKGKFRSPLHGIPWGVKDLFATAGIPTQWGSPVYRNQIFDYDATIVRKLHDAGAVLIGKLASGELASGARWFRGTTRCPWDSLRSSSGSSAGPGAATAAGMVGFSIGTETLGSIMSPSGVNGVVGLRPTYGRVSRHGAMVLSWTMDKVGPMCRSVEDCALVFDVIAGSDPLDPTAVDAQFRFSPQVSIKGRKIGVLRDEFNFASDAEVAVAFRNALEKLESLGLILEDVQLDNYAYQDIARYTINIEAASVFESLWKTDNIDMMINKQRAVDWSAARMLPAVDYLKMQRLRTEISDYASALFKKYSALVAPTLSAPAGLVEVVEIPTANPLGSLTGGSFAFGNIVGVPAVSVPCGFTSTNLPLGLQFIGPAFDEAGILRLAHAYEQANNWYERHPRL